MSRDFQTFLGSTTLLVSAIVLPLLPLSLTGCDQSSTQAPPPAGQPPAGNSDPKPTGTPPAGNTAAASGPKLSAAEQAEIRTLCDQAVALEGKNKTADAIPLMKKAIEIKKKEKPDDAMGTLYGNIAYALSTTKKYDEAVTYYNLAIKCTSPTNKLVKDYERDLDYARHQFLNAHPTVGKAAEESDKLTAAGMAAAKAKDFPEAIAKFQKAIDVRKQLPPDDALAQEYATLGWAYSNAKNWAKADESYAKALDISSPQNPNRKNYETDKGYVHSQAAKAKK